MRCIQSWSDKRLEGCALCLLGGLSDAASQEGHGGVCLLGDVGYMFAPRKVAVNSDSKVLRFRLGG